MGSRTRVPALLLERGPESVRPEPAERAAAFDIELSLETITPIVGGGVQSREPELVDPVRTASIRGHLRAWWRALRTAEGSADTLHEEETAWWGGVDVRAKGQPKPRASLVRVEMTVQDAGRLQEVGEHRERGRGRGGLATPATWRPPYSDLGYLLFPLLRNRDELDEAAAHGLRRLATPKIRERVRFSLHLSVVQPRGEQGEQLDAFLRDLSRALQLWMTFGGLGARTRRGLGALALAGPPRLRAAPTALRSVWEGWPLPDERAFRRWFSDLRSKLPASPSAAPWPTLAGAELWIGPTDRDPLRVLGHLAAYLQAFRQEAPLAKQKKHGRSLWSEADTIRGLAGHRPVDGLAPRRWIVGPPGQRSYAAPRAAFGMPLRLQFKALKQGGGPRRKDAIVEAEIHPAAQEARETPSVPRRLPSPVILRPVALRNGTVVPTVLVLRSMVPESVTVRIADEAATVGVRHVAPTATPTGVLRYLAESGGDSIEAFYRWLADTRGFEKVL